MSATPNPGSDAALDQGCTCPVLDNGRGRGFLVNGERQFWISGGCPLHDTTNGTTDQTPMGEEG